MTPTSNQLFTNEKLFVVVLYSRANARWSNIIKKNSSKYKQAEIAANYNVTIKFNRHFTEQQQQQKHQCSVVTFAPNKVQSKVQTSPRFFHRTATVIVNSKNSKVQRYFYKKKKNKIVWRKNNFLFAFLWLNFLCNYFYFLCSVFFYFRF